MEYVPAISLLGSLLLIAVVILWKFDADGLVRVFENANSVIVFASFLFVIVGVIHLFRAQDWTPDLLKIIAGVLIGASSAVERSKAATRKGGVDVAQGTFGDHARLAGRDINEMIESMHGDVAQIKDSVINQFSKVSSALEDGGVSKDHVVEFLFYTAFLAEGEVVNNAARATRRLQQVGWTLFSTGSNYAGGDGLLLLFKRVRPAREDDEALPSGGYRVRVYHGLDGIEMDYE
jgi:hypothetical protein